METTSPTQSTLTRYYILSNLYEEEEPWVEATDVTQAAMLATMLYGKRGGRWNGFSRIEWTDQKTGEHRRLPLTINGALEDLASLVAEQTGK